MPKFVVHDEDFSPDRRGRNPIADVTDFIEIVQKNEGQWVSVELPEREAKSTQRQLKKYEKTYNLQIVSRISEPGRRTILCRMLDS